MMGTTINWSPGVTLEAVEKQAILLAYGFYKQNKTQTANALGISVRTLDERLKKFAVEDEEQKKRDEDELRKRNEFLSRSRGNVPNYIYGDENKPQQPGRESSPSEGSGASSGNVSATATTQQPNGAHPRKGAATHRTG